MLGCLDSKLGWFLDANAAQKCRTFSDFIEQHLSLEAQHERIEQVFRSIKN